MANDVRKWMRAELESNLSDYLDSANVLNATKLAEAADCHFFPNNYEDIDESLFETSVKVVERVTMERGLNR